MAIRWLIPYTALLIVLAFGAGRWLQSGIDGYDYTRLRVAYENAHVAAVASAIRWCGR